MFSQSRRPRSKPSLSHPGPQDSAGRYLLRDSAGRCMNCSVHKTNTKSDDLELVKIRYCIAGNLVAIKFGKIAQKCFV